MVSLPLLVMTFGLLELAMVFLANVTLDNATYMAAREIRTGEFQTSGATAQSDFKTLVCSRMSWLSAQCPTALWVGVQTFSSFATLAAAPGPNPTTFNPVKNPPCFSPGQPTDIVLVNSYFEWNLFTPLLNNALENMGGGSGKRLLTSTTAFRNEPYNTNPPQGAGC
ncbi:MAG: pilus assembly protein [Phenylobacterium sp.]|nr:MAG: pilus assembly protein [Phenylobacterium sp.]